MTCIVGLVNKGKVYIGADSCGSNGFTKETRIEAKVFKNGEFFDGMLMTFVLMEDETKRFAEEYKRTHKWKKI